MRSPFEKIGTIPKCEEIIAKIQRRYVKLIEEFRTTKDLKIREKEIARINLVHSILKSSLNKVIMRFPHVNRIHPFYRDLLNVLIGVENYRRSLIRLSKATRIIDKIHRECLSMLKLARKPKEYSETRRSCIGRMISVLKRNRKFLDFLSDSTIKLKMIPAIDPETPTIIVAGMPQVGKSTLVKAVSTAEPEIASYPFTTKNLVLGHLNVNHFKFQVIDTPGLLDRPLSERNPIELQAIMALKHIKGVIVYLFDVSIIGYYSVEEQLHVLEDVENSFHKKIFIALNKIDIKDEKKVYRLTSILREKGYEKIYPISAAKNIGVNELKKDVIKELTIIATT